MTKLFYRGAPAALLLGLIVGAPDIAQAVEVPSITGSVSRSQSPQTPLPPYIPAPQVNKPLPPVNKPLPPIPASALPTPPKGILKAPNGRGAPVPPSERPSSVTNQTVPAPQGTPPPAFPSSQQAAAAKAAARAAGRGGGGGAGIDLTHAGDDGDANGL
jgi:hypothetical protein